MVGIRKTLLEKYYLITPIFLGLEALYGTNFRVALPWGEGVYIYAYLAVCFVVGGLILKKPSHINIFAIIECSINILLLVLSVYLPIVTVASNPDYVGGVGMSRAELIQFVLVSGVLIFGFHNNPLLKNSA